MVLADREGLAQNKDSVFSFLFFETRQTQHKHTLRQSLTMYVLLLSWEFKDQLAMASQVLELKYMPPHPARQNHNSFFILSCFVF